MSLPKPFYEDKWGVIYNADCREILPLLPKVDLVLTDPPYGIKRDGGFGGFGGFGTPIARRTYDDDWDSETPPRETFDMILEKASTILIFGGNYFTDYLPIGKHWIVWDKLQTMPSFGACELIWTNVKRTSISKYTCEYNGLIGKEDYRYHPTQKPVKLLTRLITDYSQCDTVILDPFLGSGTTAVAAKKLNRHYIGVEISEKYAEIAARRLSQMVMDLECEQVKQGQGDNQSLMFDGMATRAKGDKVADKMSISDIRKEANG